MGIVGSSMNVRDQYKDKTPEDIKAIYESNACGAAIAMTHISGDFNLGTVVRNANFFGLREAFYIGGSRQWDRRSAVGTHNYIPFVHSPDLEDFTRRMNGSEYTLVALECNVNIPDAYVQNLYEFKWPRESMIIVGEEQCGLPIELLRICKHIVEIPAFGTVRSMNVGTASGIAMSHYRSQHLL